MTAASVPFARAVPSPPDDPQPLREATARFESVLLAQALRPLAASLGFYGDLVVEAVCAAVVR